MFLFSVDLLGNMHITMSPENPKTILGSSGYFGYGFIVLFLLPSLLSSAESFDPEALQSGFGMNVLVWSGEY